MSNDDSATGGSVTSSIDLLDSEILRVEQALIPLKAKTQQSLDMEGFRKEIIGRFQEQGFRVEVKTWYTNLPGVFAFDIDIVDRIEHTEGFDFERQSHEVVNDLLGIEPERKGQIIKAPNNRSTPKGFIIKD